MGRSLSPALVLIVVVCSLRPSSAVDSSSDRIDWLPNGPENPDFGQYSGYLTLGRLPKREDYFYYFIEAMGDDPTTKPLILYLGCQEAECSPIGAAFQQLGPYKVDTDGQSLVENPNSWNKLANLLLIEVPITVGYSFTTSTVDELSERTTSVVIHKLLNIWYHRFPAYRGSDLYIAGMNDIATLAPFLALRLLHQNKLRRRPPVNIKGLIMGNPSFDLSLNTDMRAEYYWNIGIMPTSTYLTYLRDCANNPNADYGSDTGGFDVPECMEIWYPVSISTSYLDPFSLYGPPCPGIDQNNIQGPESFTEFVYTCDDQNVAGYFSIPFVQRAIHVRPPPGMTDPPVWLPIKGVGYWKRNVTSAGDYLKSVMEKGVNVLAYSGILDFELPIVSADKALSQMNLTMDTQWRPWFAKSPIEFAGYMTSAKEGLTYATLRNSGRKSSEDQPENVYALVDSFLNNKPLAKSSYFLMHEACSANKTLHSFISLFMAQPVPDLYFNSLKDSCIIICGYV